jgi:hypothetical protein
MRQLFFLLPLFVLTYKVLPVSTAIEPYTFELTVKSQKEGISIFDLTIEGHILTSNGDPVPFRFKKKGLQTPYHLDLESGQYKITVEKQSGEGTIISKVQGIQDRRKMGSSQGSSKKTILEAGPGGTYRASGEN